MVDNLLLLKLQAFLAQRLNDFFALAATFTALIADQVDSYFGVLLMLDGNPHPVALTVAEGNILPLPAGHLLADIDEAGANCRPAQPVVQLVII